MPRKDPAATPFSPDPCPPAKPWRARGLRGWWIKRCSRLLNAPTSLADEHGGLRDHNWIGRHGEDIAARFLQATGHRILARNFKKEGGGEVDVIAGRGRLLLFVEVKTRARHTKVRPFDAVTPDKQRLIERGANQWLRKLRTRDVPWRFDVIEIWLEPGSPPQINHIRDAF
jgi:putative endonuclease